jgi:sulfhydrogenase subunit alpha
MTTKTIKVNYLARVEGEAALQVRVKGGVVVDVALNIFEPPRFFEALLRGRAFTEAPDITARICGICPVAYQMSAVHAMERACGVAVDGQLRQLRRLMYCGEWIESHVLHVYMLHAPDFLGYPDAITLAKDYPDIVRRGLQLKKIGNEIVALLGGREIHPINVRVGGFYRVPARSELAELRERLLWAREAALETVRWAATLPFPELEGDYEYVSLRHPDEYPMNEGHIVSSKGLDIAADQYERHFQEEQVARSTALHSVIVGRGAYLVGPLARYSLNFDRLSPLAQSAATDAGLGPECRNPFQSIIVRAVETLYACDEAIRIIEQYEPPEAPAVRVDPRSGTGHAATEAPRGLLFHRYTIDSEGTISTAKIVPPTSQNQKTIEDDLHRVVSQHIDLPKDELTLLCEQTVRNYDPCISCSTHFLRLDLTDEGGTPR